MRREIACDLTIRKYYVFLYDMWKTSPISVLKVYGQALLESGNKKMQIFGSYDAILAISLVNLYAIYAIYIFEYCADAWNPVISKSSYRF